MTGIFLRATALALALAFPASGVGCTRTAAAVREDPAAPDIEVKDGSEGLLLTWIDEKGDFHVEQKVTDVPIVGRDAVRVVDPAKDEGTHRDRIAVADLRAARPNGTYPVRTLTRAEFDALAITRREKHGQPTLASAAPASPDAPPYEGRPTPLAPPGGNAAPGAVAARPAVIIYGASWCGACHQAAAWLKKKNVSYVEKDIEADAKADEEMRAKLDKAGLRGGSIPVIDVRGVVMVGFSAPRVEEALGRTL